MKKSILLSVLFLASLSATFVSCKKEDKEKSRKDLIAGTWAIKLFGEDANGNDMLEPSEYDSNYKEAVAIGIYIKQTYNADGSGINEFLNPGLKSDSSVFNWSLQDNDQTLRIVDKGSTAPIDLTIINLNSNSFSYKGKTPGNGKAVNIAVLTR